MTIGIAEIRRPHVACVMDGTPSQATFSGALCRAAASRERAAQRSRSPSPAPESNALGQTAQSRTQSVSGADWLPATAAEEAMAERLRRKFPELWEAASQSRPAPLSYRAGAAARKGLPFGGTCRRRPDGTAAAGQSMYDDYLRRFELGRDARPPWGLRG